MKEFTKEEKMTLLAEINDLLATIPDYQLVMSESDIDYHHILISDQGYINRLYLEYGEIYEEFIGATREEAIRSLAHTWIVSYGWHLYIEPLRSWEKREPYDEKYQRFCALCDSYIFKA